MKSTENLKTYKHAMCDTHNEIWTHLEGDYTQQKIVDETRQK